MKENTKLGLESIALQMYFPSKLFTKLFSAIESFTEITFGNWTEAPLTQVHTQSHNTK